MKYHQLIIELDSSKRVVVKVESLEMKSEEVGKAGELEAFVGVAEGGAMTARVLVVSVQ